MKTQLVNRYAVNMHGVLSCYDRIVISGTLPEACYAGRMGRFFVQKGVRIFDYAQFSEPLRIRAHAQDVSGKTYLRSGTGKCPHDYFYFIDEERLVSLVPGSHPAQRLAVGSLGHAGEEGCGCRITPLRTWFNAGPAYPLILRSIFNISHFSCAGSNTGAQLHTHTFLHCFSLIHIAKTSLRGIEMSNTNTDNEPVPFMQKLLDNPFILLFLGVMIPMIVYTLWGVIDILTVPLAK